MRMTTPLARGPIAFQSSTGFISMTDSLHPFRSTPDPWFLVQLEIDGQVENDVDRLAVERAGPELPPFDRFRRGCVQAERQRLEDLHVGHVAVLVDDALNDDDAGDARLAGHLRIARLDSVDDHRRLDIAADAQRSLD